MFQNTQDIYRLVVYRTCSKIHKIYTGSGVKNMFQNTQDIYRSVEYRTYSKIHKIYTGQ